MLRQFFGNAIGIAARHAILHFGRKRHLVND